MFDISKNLVPENLKHIAIIMDGNGRWAKRNLKTRTFGHRQGSKVINDVTVLCANAGLKVLSLFAFSTENWLRPEKEINTLKKLLISYLKKEKKTILKNNIIFTVSGSYLKFGEEVSLLIKDLKTASKNNTGMVLNLCLSYSGRSDIIEAVNTLAKDIISEKISANKIDEKTFSQYFENGHLPDPDLLIRTSGELRISNFMLWQLAYTELYFTNVLWPEFDSCELSKAIESFLNRKRRFGLVDNQNLG